MLYFMDFSLNLLIILKKGWYWSFEKNSLDDDGKILNVCLFSSSVYHIRSFSNRNTEEAFPKFGESK